VQNSALHYACAGGHVKAVELLLEKKADVTLTNTYNETPLDQAIDNQHNDVVVALLKNRR
jgi:ankyrin repeat protein